jgi:tape measure domain-containing protein
MATGVEIANAYVALQVRMPNASRDIAVELGKAESSTAGIGQRIGGGLLSGIGTVLKGGAAVVGGTIAAAVGTSLVKGFARLDAIDTARAKLTGLGNDAGTVATVMENALGAVRGTAFGLGDAATVAAQLVAAQIKPGEQLSGVLKSVTNSAAAAGVGMGEMGSIYAKVASVGKAQNDSLQQVAQRGIPIYQTLATQLGVSTDEIFSMATRGEIDFERFSSAMTAAAGTVADEVGGTVKGTWANFISSLGRVGAGLMSGLYPKIAPFLKALTTALGPLEEIAARAGASLATWIGPWIDSLTAWVAAIDFNKVVDGLVQVWQAGVDVKDLLTTGFTENEASGLLSPEVVKGLQITHDIFASIGGAVKEMFSAFTGSSDMEGATAQFGSIGTSVSTLKPALSAFAAELPKIGEATATLAAGGLDILTNVLSFLADHVDTIIQFMPLIVAGFIAWRVASTAVANATLALRAGELAATPVYLANNIMRNNSARIEAANTAAKIASTGATNAHAAATSRGTIATIASSTAARVAAAGQWLLNAALSANPIGIVIVAITALVGALVWFFTQTELGQEIWSAFMTGLGVVATWLWENVLRPVFTAIGAIFQWLWDTIILPIGTLIVNYYRFWGAVAVWLWQNVLEPTFAAIGQVFTWIWENVISPIVGLIVGYFRFWGAVVVWLWENVVSPVFAAIGQVFSWIWTTIIEPIVGFIGLALQALGAIFQWLYANVIKPVWDGISTTISTVWTWIDQNVFTPFKLGIELIGQTFDNVARGIAVAWEGIKAAAAAPINFVLDTVWNNGLRSFWNDLVGELGLSDMKLPKADLVKFASGGVLPGYTPGRDVHQFWSPTAGGLALSGGEAIMRPEFTRAVGGAAGVDALNKAAREGRAFANGGVLDFAGDVWNNIQNAAGVAWEFLSDPGGAIQKHVIDGIIRPLLGDQNIFGQTVGALATNTVKSMAGLFADAAPAVSGGKGMGWEAMWNTVHARFPDVNLNSAYRPGSPGYHGKGRAVDLTPRMDVFNWLKASFPGSSELIYSPAGSRQLQNGREHYWPEPVRSAHFNHVHWAMANGGVVPKLYDQGGWIPHGGMAVNLSGRPEAVLTPDQSAAYVAGRGGGDTHITVQALPGMTPQEQAELVAREFRWTR